MDVSEDSCEKALSPVCRARCHTWHSGLEHVSPGSTSVRNSPISSESPSVSDHCAGVKKPSSRRNAWGSASYADLIATAIESSPERRLTLSQIYDWIISNVHYFSDKSDSNSSAGWKNSIRHNLSLHRRFVRVPHSDGKSAWWTVGGGNADSTTPSAPRWSRSTGTTRHRADTMDPRSYSLQQQRQRRANRKSATDNGSADHHNTDKKPCLEINVTTNFTPSNCDGFTLSPDDIFAPLTIGVHCQTQINFPDAAKLSVGRSCLNSDSFLPSSTFGTDPSIENQAPPNLASSFGSKRLSVQSAYDSLSLLNDDDSSSAMVTQLSPLSTWNQSDGSEHLFGTESSCAMNDDRLSELFSDVAMSHDDSVSFLSNHDLQRDDATFCGTGAAAFCSTSEAAFCGDDDSAASASGNAALMLAALTSVVPSLRRGSDAPPPSPESSNSDCDVPSSVLNEPIGGLSLSKNIDLENDSAILGLSFPTGWTLLSPFKSDDVVDVSNLSDMDMDH